VERRMTKRPAELAEERIAGPTTANLTAMKYFGSAVAELFECSSCYVASCLIERARNWKRRELDMPPSIPPARR
jgi:hypothetical protein